MIQNTVVAQCVREQSKFNETNFGGLSLPKRALISLYSEYRLKVGCQLKCTFIIPSPHAISYTGFNDSCKKAGNLFLFYTADLQTSLHRKNLSAAE